VIRAIPAFDDNYIWIVTSDSDDPAAVVVDPGDPEPVLRDLERHGLSLAAILVTHHHGDHQGGVAALAERAPKRHPGRHLPVYGPKNTAIPAVNVPVGEGDVVEISELNMRLSVMEVPGHTLDHLAFFGFCESTDPVLFCGDTLFAGGCGRLFEGSAQQMWHSLLRLMQLPPETAVYCAHEYTLSNLQFAKHAFPDHPDIQSRLIQVKALRQSNVMTLPSSMAMERLTNPFLLCKNEAEFATMRKAKDHFRG
jgi:hydroxyacylglutathione hydrolase